MGKADTKKSNLFELIVENKLINITLSGYANWQKLMKYFFHLEEQIYTNYNIQTLTEK